MTTEVATVPASMPVEDALRLMRQRGIHSVIVEPEQPGGAYGIMTQRDLLRKIVAADRPLLNVAVRDLMTSPLITVSPDTTIRQCSIIMLGDAPRGVMKDSKLAGIISDTDIFRPSGRLGAGLIAEHRRGGVRHNRRPTPAGLRCALRLEQTTVGSK
jgi:isocitrate dehydrogenase